MVFDSEMESNDGSIPGLENTSNSDSLTKRIQLML